MSEAVSSVAAEEKETIVTRKDLLEAWRKWTLAVEVPISFDRVRVPAFGYSMNKVLRKLYKDDPEELQAAMRHHTSMFNTNCDWKGIVRGVTISLEEQRTLGHDGISPETIRSPKLGLTGPLAGIGDGVDQGIVTVTPLAIFVPMALGGSVIATFIPGLIYIAWNFGWSWFLFNKGYSLGKSSVLEILHSGAIKKVIDIASVTGLFMTGCLSTSYIRVQTIVEFASDTSTAKLQRVIDGILPNILPFIIVMGMYLYITKRGPKYIRLMVYAMIIAIVLAFSHTV